MDGKLVIGMNRHREICTMQLSGNILLLKDQIKRCVSIATTKCIKLTEYLQEEFNKSKPKYETHQNRSCVVKTSGLDEKMDMV
jgi:hypothetical protein